MENKRKVAIDVDFIVRDWVSALISTYQKQIDDTWDEQITDVSKIWEYFKFPVYKVDEKNVRDGVDYDGDPETADIIEVVLTMDENAPFEVNKEYFNNFVADNLLEIFGHAKEGTLNSMYQINRLAVEKPNFEVTLYTKGKGKLIPATLFFLSKVGCEVKNIKFINYYTELSEFDVVITGVSGLADDREWSYVLFNTPYNSDEKYCDMRIDSITDLYDLQS